MGCLTGKREPLAPARALRCGRGHRPCQSARPIFGTPGAKAPGQRPPRPRRALACRCSRTCRSTRHRSARAGKRAAFPVPARRGFCALRYPGRIGTSGVGGRPAVNPCIGRGHRPRRNAALNACQPPGGRITPAGSGTGLSLRLRDGSLWNLGLGRGGKTRCVSGSTRNGKPLFRRIRMIFPSGRRRGCFPGTLSERLEGHGRQGAYDSGNVEQAS
jgi:hypothetical protein